MPNHMIPMVSASEFAAIARAVDEMFGHTISRRVFSDHGFSEMLLHDPTMQLPNTEYMRFLEACARVTGEPIFGAKIGSAVPFCDLGLYGQYVTSAPTLRTALDRAVRALRYHETGSRLDITMTDHRLRIVYVPPTPKALGSWHQSDGIAALLMNLIAQYQNDNWSPTLIRVAAADSMRIARLGAFLGAPVQERAIGTEIIGEIPQEPTCNHGRAGPFTWRDLRRLVASRPSESFAEVLRHLCIPLVQRGIFELDKVAEKVGVTPRTIQRRLKAEGETFGSLLSGLRREQAEQLLDETSLTMSEIAEKVGYSSKQHFIRAYKGWTGKTPSTVRK